MSIPSAHEALKLGEAVVGGGAEESIPPAREALKSEEVGEGFGSFASIPSTPEALKQATEQERHATRVSIPPACEALKLCMVCLVAELVGWIPSAREALKLPEAAPGGQVVGHGRVHRGRILGGGLLQTPHAPASAGPVGTIKIRSPLCGRIDRILVAEGRGRGG